MRAHHVAFVENHPTSIRTEDVEKVVVKANLSKDEDDSSVRTADSM